MSNNKDYTTINAPSVENGDNIAVDAIIDSDGVTVKHQRVKVQYGPNGSAIDVSTSNPLPVTVSDVDSSNPLSVEVVNNNSANVTEEGALLTYNSSSSAFGDMVTVRPNPKIQLMFPYSIDTAPIIKYTHGSGSVSSTNSQAVLSSGTTTLSDAAIASKDFVTYEPGAGGIARFTFGCTTDNSSGTYQQVGIGTQEDGFFFSYHADDMHIMLRNGGRRDQRTLTLTNEATATGSVDISLDGVVHSVPISTQNPGETNATAREIASYDWNANSSYLAYAEGNVVSFVAQRTGEKTGTFNFDPGSSGIVGSLDQQVVGVAETIKTISRSDWNIDKADGSGVLPSIDWSKGNVYQIRYQWLGYGNIYFYVENPNSGRMAAIHMEQYSNANTIPSLHNPSLQFLANVTNYNTNLNVSAFVGSVYAGVEGGSGQPYGNRVSNTFTKSIGNANYENIVSLRSPRYLEGTSNRSVISVLRVTITSSAGADFKIIRNGQLSGEANWVSVNNKLLQHDTSVADYTDSTGQVIIGDRTEQKGRLQISSLDFGSEEILKIYPGDVINVVGKSDTGTTSAGVALNWVEPI